MVGKPEADHNRNWLEININKKEYVTIAQEAIRIWKSTTGKRDTRIRQIKTAGIYHIKKALPRIRIITKTNRRRIYNMIIRSTRTYRAENWILNKKNPSKINEAEMDFRIRSCTAWIINEITNDVTKERKKAKDTIYYIKLEKTNLQWTYQNNTSQPIGSQDKIMEPCSNTKARRIKRVLQRRNLSH